MRFGICERRVQEVKCTMYSCTLKVKRGLIVGMITHRLLGKDSDAKSDRKVPGDGLPTDRLTDRQTDTVGIFSRE